MTFKGIFFDLYGTLVIYEDVQAAWADWIAAFYERLRESGLSMAREDFARRCDGFFGRPAPPKKDDGLTIYERRIRAFGAELGLELGDLAVQKAAQVTVEAFGAYASLDPDAPAVLEALRARKKVALISNFDHPPHVYLLLAKYGLARFFNAVVVSGEVGIEKPDPRIFSLALQKTGLWAQEVAYVGDAQGDVDGALAAGLHPILVRRGEEDIGWAAADFRVEQRTAESAVPDGVQVIDSLRALLEIGNADWGND